MATKPVHTFQRFAQTLCFLAITSSFYAYQTRAQTIEFLDCFQAAAFEINQHLSQGSTGFLDVQGGENGSLKLLATDQIQLGIPLAVYHSNPDSLMRPVETTHHLEPGFYEYEHAPPPKGDHQLPSNSKHSVHGILLRKNGQKVLLRFTTAPMTPELCQSYSGDNNQQLPKNTDSNRCRHSVTDKGSHRPDTRQKSKRQSTDGSASQGSQGTSAPGGGGEPPEPPDNSRKKPDDYDSDEELETLRRERLKLLIRTLIFSIQKILSRDTTADNPCRESLDRKCDSVDRLILRLKTYDKNDLTQDPNYQRLETLLSQYQLQSSAIRNPKPTFFEWLKTWF